MKAQSAFEYLMTYGWAVLVLILIVTLLWYIGLFRPPISPICSMEGGVICETYQLVNDTNDLHLRISNHAGRTMQVTGFVCSQNQQVAPKNLNNPITIRSGDSAWIVGGDSGNSATCTDADDRAIPSSRAPIGDVYKGAIRIRYADVSTGQVHTAFGDIVARYEPLGIATPTSTPSAFPTPSPTPSPSPSPTPSPSQGCNAPTQGDWAISSTVVCSGETINMNGSVLISGGSLRLVNSELIMNPPGYNLAVIASSTSLSIESSTIRSGNGNKFPIMASGNAFNVTNSQISGLSSVSVNSASVSFASNTITNSGTWVFSGSNYAINNNVVTNSSFNLAGSGHNVQGNTMTGQAYVGAIQVWGVSGSTISNNVLTGGSTYGIHLRGATANTVTGNTITSTTTGGILLESGSGNTISNNVIRNSGNANGLGGIYLLVGGNTLTGNTVCSNLPRDFTCRSDGYYSGSGNSCGSTNCTGLTCSGC